MSFSYSFRDKPRLSDRIRGKSGDELLNELRKEFDQDRSLFFNKSSTKPTSNLGSSGGSTFQRAGNLFEEPSGRSHFDIKSHLEDLAQRHPEFADQLRYPAWSNDSKSNTWGRKRRGSEDPNSEEASKQQQQESTTSPQTEEQNLPRGRPKDNLRNTVPDMGQKQQQEAEDKESRGQRSWSAPPDNRAQQEKPRFVSKIEITPVNPDAPQTGDAAKPPMAPPKPQPQQQHQAPPQSQPKSNVRHIPIFVEGRDEPVLPKNVEPEFSQSQAPPQNFSRPSQHQFQQQMPQSQAPPQHFSQPTQHQFHQQMPQRRQTPPQFEHPTAPPPEPTQHQQPEQHQEQQETSPVNPRDPLYQVSCVQKEVDELKSQIDNFNGMTRADKQYILLDELLTRNLIKLDNIDTDGKEEVRTARKNAIKSIQKCISVLENKVPTPGNESKEIDLEQSQEGAVSDNQDRQASVDNQMEVVDEKPQETPSGDSNVPSASDTSQASTIDDKPAA